jgi:hypothetical protein
MPPDAPADGRAPDAPDSPDAAPADVRIPDANLPEAGRDVPDGGPDGPAPGPAEPEPLGDPVAVRAGEALHVFAATDDGELLGTSFSAGAWSPWQPILSKTAGPPHAAVTSTGALHLFVRGRDGLVHWSRQARAQDPFVKEAPIGAPSDGLASDPFVLRWSGDLLALFALRRSGDVVVKHQIAGTPARWSDWTTALERPEGTGYLGRPAAVVGPEGRLVAFARDGDGNLQHGWQEVLGSPPSAAWRLPWPLGRPGTTTLVGSPRVNVSKTAAISVHVRGMDGAVWELAQTTAGGAYSQWKTLDGATPAEPAVVQANDEALQIFVRGSDDTLQTRFQRAVNGDWQEWRAIDPATKIAGAPHAIIGPSGALHVFVRDKQGRILTTSQTHDLGLTGSRFRPLSPIPARR